MNGVLTLPLWFGQYFVVAGGPIRSAPQNEALTTVKMAAEIQCPCTISIPTRDFHVPAKTALDAGLIQAVQLITSGRPVYVGCMAGRGRTGLFLAVLAKAFGVADPVEYVRRVYYSHAVETEEQYRFVRDYAIPPEVKRMVFWSSVFGVFRLKRNLTSYEGTSLEAAVAEALGAA